jgi:hypothetical protein
MFNISKFVFIYSIINCITIVALVSIREWPTDDIIVNINKGYALRRIGAYSTNMVEQVVHTFLSLDDFCAVQATDAVCIYIQNAGNAQTFFQLGANVSRERQGGETCNF